MAAPAAPAWSTDRWFNTAVPLTLDALRGRVVMLHAFQMLCPGCVSHGVPQAQRVARQFADAPVTVVGLHTVFEHHDVMGPEALAVFLQEYRVTFPVAVDRPGLPGDTTPQTMRAYRMRGTPTVVLIDAVGRLRQQVFGIYDDLHLGRALGSLVAEAKVDIVRPFSERPARATPGCDDAEVWPFSRRVDYRRALRVPRLLHRAHAGAALLRYASGEDVRTGDVVDYDGLPAEVELVVTSESTAPDREWHFRSHGAGVLLLEPTTFGRVYVTDLPNTPRLVLVSRRAERPT